MQDVERRTRWDLVVAGAAMASVLLFGVWLRATGGEPTAVDLWWHDLALVPPGSPAYWAALGLAQVGGSAGVSVCVALAAGVLLLRRRFREATSIVAAALLGVTCSELLKVLVARPRPVDRMIDPSGLSYPSGHSMGAAVLAVSLVLVIAAVDRRSRALARWAACGATVWVLLMMGSRTVLGVHWLTDTVAGALLGLAAAIAAARLVQLPRGVSSAG